MDNKIKAILFDLSGVIYQAGQLIPGALDCIKEARARQLILRFVTNTATKNSAQIIKNLAAMGIDVNEDELYTAPTAARQYIQQHQLRPFCLVHKNLHDEFSLIDQQQPNCVLLGDARDDLTYQNLNTAFQLCIQGAPLIAIGKNKYFKEAELMLDAGAFVHAIEWAADTQALIMGKPAAEFFAQVVTSTGLQADQCLMIGDDVQADVLAAQAAGLNAVLVKTGKFQPADLDQVSADTLVLASVASLFNH